MKERFIQGRSGGIPVFFILEPDGTIVSDCVGPDGNIGSPYTDEEIAWFGEMMKKAAVTITADEIEVLMKIFVQARDSGID
ncbi:hypothetical protein ACFL3H_03400 [Gemmatimonadota bacterium]